MDEQKKRHAKRIRWIAGAIAVALALAVGGVFLVLHLQTEKLQAIRSEKLEELLNNEGRYDAQSIVLNGTSLPRAEALADKLGATLRISKDGKFATLTLAEGTTIEDVYRDEAYLEELSQMAPDLYADPAELASTQVGLRQPIAPEYTVTDTLYEKQTYLNYLDLRNCWWRTKGKNITVAVIDTGIDTDHPEFAGRISEYSYNASQDRIVKDFKDETGAYDWSLIEDEVGHGTSVAGVIAAAMDGAGTVGIAPEVTLLVIKADCDANGQFLRTSDLVFGLYYAIERNANVVNMSFGTSTNVFEAPALLAADSEILCVAAAGNDATAQLTYPAADVNVIGVGALAEDSWDLADYSNYGENVDICAPGTVYTTAMGGGYDYANGTSMAAPIVAGTVALQRSIDKYIYISSVREMLFSAGTDLGDLGR